MLSVLKLDGTLSKLPSTASHLVPIQYHSHSCILMPVICIWPSVVPFSRYTWSGNEKEMMKTLEMV